MDERGAVRLGPREQEIVDLLLQGCSNAEIAKTMGMNRRTVKAHFNRLFEKFGIHGGIKRVKLATLLYRRQLCLESNEERASEPAGASNHRTRCPRTHEPGHRRRNRNHRIRRQKLSSDHLRQTGALEPGRTSVVVRGPPAGTPDVRPVAKPADRFGSNRDPDFRD